MRKYLRIPIFSNNLLNGYYKYKDEFQIYPLVSSFQVIPSIAKAKPIIFEIAFEENNYRSTAKNIHKITKELNVDVSQLNTLTPAYNKATNVLNLLTAFSNFRFYHYTPEECWTLNSNDNRNSRSFWGMKTFTYPEFIEEFSLNIDLLTKDVQFGEIPKITFLKYFEMPKMGSFQEINFLTEIDSLLDQYFLLNQGTRRKVDSICKLISSGIQLFGSSKSLSFVSFISCIETLTSMEYKEEDKTIVYACNSCKKIKESTYTCECGEPIWGISYKFKKFLATYVSNSESSKTIFNKLYSLRCKIVHDGQLFLADSGIDWDVDDKVEEQWVLHTQLQQITRIALINWLLTSPNVQNETVQ